MFLEYGVNKSNRYVHISQVTSGRVPLQCPYCGQSLIARKGTQKEHHFAHDGNTCREASRDFEALNIPYFDRFHTFLDGRTWQALQDFHMGNVAKARLLEGKELIRWNDFAGRGHNRGDWELTHLGKIPFGEAILNQFQDHQKTAIWKRHRELSEAVQLAQFGEQAFSGRYIKQPAPDMVLPNLTDLNIYRSQIARVFSLNLYLLEIETHNGLLYKIGVTADIDRRMSEIRRDLSAHVTIKKIEVDRLLAHRGAVERYTLHRYRDYQVSIGNLTEYFQFDNKTISQVRRDFTMLGDFKLADNDNRYIKNYANEITHDNDMPRFTITGLITSIIEGQPAQIETLVQDTIRSENIRKGTIEGMQRAKEAGIHVGRPSEDNQAIIDKYPNVIECINKGLSLRMTATECNVSVNTVRKIKSILAPDL